MEDHVGAVLGEHLAHPLLLLAVGQHGDGAGEVAVLLEVAADLEEVVLGVVEQDEALGRHARDLPAQLGADRAAGAGDEHGLVVQVGPDALELHPHGLAAEDVLDADLADLPHDGRAAAEELEDRRRRADGDRADATRGDDTLAHGARRRWDGDDDLVGLGLVEHATQIVLVRGAQNLEVGAQPHVELARVVVDEADRAVAQVGVARHLAHHELAALAGADDQDAAGVLARAHAAHGSLEAALDRPARGAEQRDLEQEEEHGDAGRDRHRDVGVERAPGAGHERVRDDRVQDRDQPDDRERRDDDGLQDRLVVALRRVAPPLRVQAEDRVDREARRDDPREAVPEQAVVARREVGVEAKVEGQDVRGGHEHGVDHELRERVPVHGQARGERPPLHGGGF